MGGGALTGGADAAQLGGALLLDSMSLVMYLPQKNYPKGSAVKLGRDPL